MSVIKNQRIMTFKLFHLSFFKIILSFILSSLYCDDELLSFASEIKGKVIDKKSGLPLSGVIIYREFKKVSLADKSKNQEIFKDIVTTNKEGEFYLAKRYFKYSSNKESVL